MMKLILFFMVLKRKRVLYNLNFLIISRYETQRSRLVSDPSHKILIDYGTDDPVVTQSAHGANKNHPSPNHYQRSVSSGEGLSGHHAHTHHHMPGTKITSIKKVTLICNCNYLISKLYTS